MHDNVIPCELRSYDFAVSLFINRSFIYMYKGPQLGQQSHCRSQLNTGCTLCSDHTLMQLVKYPLSQYRTIIYCTIDDITASQQWPVVIAKERQSIMITSYHTHLFYIVAIIPNQAFHQHNKRAWRTTWGNRFFLSRLSRLSYTKSIYIFGRRKRPMFEGH